ncbi:hypothetical protein I3842_03G128000 [Carya illinoinensis]|uniref:Uncharacterized protein n=1 Tax=Carya illinoinensis TaxID=32201 RepID=A0A922FKD2_CARIL|nr:hypothetical protein I3842_03G128000 [Carya illinoinensis]
MERSKSFSGYNSSTPPYSDIRSGFEDRSNSYSFNSTPINRSGGNIDRSASSSGNPLLKKRKRLASYNMYAMEGKLKSSFRNSFKWIKSKFTRSFDDEQVYRKKKTYDFA